MLIPIFYQKRGETSGIPRLDAPQAPDTMDHMARSDVTDWLLEGEPWVRYRTRVDLLGQSEKGASHLTHKLAFAADILHALLSFGLAKNTRVGKALRHLLSLVRENGWPCAVSPSLGKFRGPGRRGDPCPYATPLMLKVLSAIVAAQADANGRFTAQSRAG